MRECCEGTVPKNPAGRHAVMPLIYSIFAALGSTDLLVKLINYSMASRPQMWETAEL